MTAILARIQREPALVTGAIAAVLALVTAFGLDLSAAKVGAIMALTSALLALVTRSLVSPASTVAAQVVDGQLVAGPAIPTVAGQPVQVVATLDPVPAVE